MHLHAPTMLAALVSLAAAFPPVSAQEAERMSIEVFPFELMDKSAGAGIIPPDDYDRRYLSEATQMAKDMLDSPDASPSSKPPLATTWRR